MQTTLIMVVGFAILAHALSRAPKQRAPTWSQHLKGSQKLFGVIALFLMLLMALNPEFLALGLLGDAAFFDLMVLALSLQMHMFASRIWRGCVTTLANGMRWAPTLGAGDLYLLDALKRGVANTVPALQQALCIRSQA